MTWPWKRQRRVARGVVKESVQKASDLALVGPNAEGYVQLFHLTNKSPAGEQFQSHSRKPPRRDCFHSLAQRRHRNSKCQSFGEKEICLSRRTMVRNARGHILSGIQNSFRSWEEWHLGAELWIGGGSLETFQFKQFPLWDVQRSCWHCLQVVSSPAQ